MDPTELTGQDGTLILGSQPSPSNASNLLSVVIEQFSTSSKKWQATLQDKTIGISKADSFIKTIRKDTLISSAKRSNCSNV